MSRKIRSRSILSFPYLLIVGLLLMAITARMEALPLAQETTIRTLVSRLFPASTSEESDQDAESEWLEQALAELVDRGLDLNNPSEIITEVASEYPQASIILGDTHYEKIWNPEDMLWETRCISTDEIILFEQGVENPIVISIETTMNLGV